MNAPFPKPLTDRELRWLRHIAVHGPQSSEFLLELVSDTHRCKDTGLRTLQKLRETQYLRLPPQQNQIAKADFNPHVYDLTRQSIQYLQGVGDAETVRPAGHWWHAFLTSSITSAIATEAARRGYRYIPANDILNRSGAPLAIPVRRQKLIPDQLFALNYGGTFRSFVLEVDRSTEPYQSKNSRKSIERMLEQYAEVFEKDIARAHYGLKSPLLLLMVFVCPGRAARVLEMLSRHSVLQPVSLVQAVPMGFPRYAQIKNGIASEFRRSGQSPLALLNA